MIELTDHDATIRAEGATAMLAASKASLARLAEEIALFVEYNAIEEPGMHSPMVERQPGDVDGFELMLVGPVSDVPA